MKRYIISIIVTSILVLAGVVVRKNAQPPNTVLLPAEQANGVIVDACGATTRQQQAPAMVVIEIPPGYRDWKLISVAREEGDLNDIRAILGNDIAINASRDGSLPFPDGAIIARLAWSYDGSDENNKAFGRAQSFVAGLPKNGLQFMIKDSNKYGSTGGWGFAHFNDGKPANAEVMRSCFPCHLSMRASDLIFTRYSP